MTTPPTQRRRTTSHVLNYQIQLNVTAARVRTGVQ